MTFIIQSGFIKYYRLCMIFSARKVNDFPFPEWILGDWNGCCSGILIVESLIYVQYSGREVYYLSINYDLAIARRQMKLTLTNTSKLVREGVVLMLKVLDLRMDLTGNKEDIWGSHQPWSLTGRNNISHDGYGKVILRWFCLVRTE